MKRVFIVHGWDGFPEEGWFPWLKKELEAKGFEVQVPAMPEADKPRIYNWIPELKKAVGTPDAETYFVGHSMGCQAIARYLEALPETVKVGGAVFVAGFFKRLKDIEVEEEVREIAKHWLETPLDLQIVRTHLPKSIAIFSDNDPFVTLDNQDDFREILGAEIIIEHEAGHFSGLGDGIKELPIVLEKILKISQN